MSRAQNARCNKKQEAQDYQMAGTGLMLEMIENERLCKLLAFFFQINFVFQIQ